MSWARGGKSTAAADSAESNLESQNEQHLNDLHAKLQNLRGVTTDIYQDSRNQNSLLDGTSGAFDQFKTSLAGTTSKFARDVQSGRGSARWIAGSVSTVVVLFFLYKIFGGSGSAPVA